MKKLAWVIFFVFVCSSIGWGAEVDLLIDINIPEYKLQIYAEGELIFKGPIGVGRTNHETPLGEYMVMNRIENPTWYPKGKDPVLPGPTNPLGQYWLGLSIKGYGIHGNTNPASIGRLASSGCIRMKNEDIQYLYHLIQVGTSVTIRYQTLFLEQKSDEEPYLRILQDVYGLGSNNIFEFLHLVKNVPWQREVFIPYLSTLLQDCKEGIVSIPWKVDCYYQGQVYANLCFRYQGQIYLDPRGISGLLEEDQLYNLLREKEKRYFRLQDVIDQLVHHQIVIRNDQKVIFIIEESLDAKMTVQNSHDWNSVEN